jgi:membrane peptidoglycan carboxypeptidase
VPAAEAPGRVRRRAPQPGRAPADALTTPVGPALRGEVLAALDRGAPPRGSRTPQAAGTSRSGSGSSRRPEPGRATAPCGRLSLLSRLPRDRRCVLQLLAAALGVAALAPVVAFLLGYVFFAVPTPDDAVNNQVALISYADGSQLTRLVPEQGNRMVVPVDQVPRYVRDAVLAAEDRSFYSNPGFDLSGIVRAVGRAALDLRPRRHGRTRLAHPSRA